MARVMVFTIESTCNLNANRIEIENEFVKVFKDEKIIGIFDLSVVRAAYVSEKDKPKKENHNEKVSSSHSSRCSRTTTLQKYEMQDMWLS